MSISFIAIVVTAMPLVLHAEGVATEADRRAVSATMQRDALGNSQTAMALSLPISPNGWMQGGLGQATVRGGDGTARSQSRQASVGAGLFGERWQAGVNVAERRDSDRLRQRDITASVDRRIGTNWNVGVDAMRREARSTATTATNTSSNTTVTQNLDGQGMGVRVAFAATDRVTGYIAAQKSHYSGVTQSSSSTPPGGGVLGGLLTPVNRVTVVNREEAALARSLLLATTVGVNDRVAVTAEVAQDRLLDGSSLRTAQLRAAIALHDSGWTLAPGVGVSKGSNGDSVGSGSLRAIYAW